MQQKSNQTLYRIPVVLASGETKVVAVRASSQEVAEHRALKRTPTGVSVKRNNERGN